MLALILFMMALAVDYFYFTANKSSSKAAQDLPTAPLSTEEVAQKAYQQNCRRCHGDQLQGGIGPSLIDAQWIYGDGTAPTIAHVITEGSLQNGMPAWKHMLTESEINDLSLWIASKQGKHVEQK